MIELKTDKILFQTNCGSFSRLGRDKPAAHFGRKTVMLEAKKQISHMRVVHETRDHQRPPVNAWPLILKLEEQDHYSEESTSVIQ